MDHDGQRVTPGRLAAFAVAFGLLLVAMLQSQPGFVFLLDHANLLFHEAGHPLIGFFSTRLEPYAGTIGQLAFPVAIIVACWRKGQPFGVAAGGIWFFENWFNIARYMADARTLRLPLVGGGDHDWNTILFRWNLLQYDTTIAQGLQWAAWTGMAAIWLWLFWRLYTDREPLKPQAFAPIEGL